MSDDNAYASCQIVRDAFGDPESPDTILVPNGSTTAGMLAGAAVHGGIALPAKLAGKADPRLKFSKPTDPVRSHWLKLWRRFIGKERPTAPPSESAVEVVALRKEMADMQAKTTADMMEMLAENRRILNLIAQMGGVTVPAEEGDPAAAGAVGAMANATQAPVAALVEPGKSAPVAAKAEPLDEAMLARLADMVAERLRPEPELVPAGGPPPDLTAEPAGNGKTADPNRFRRSRDPRAGINPGTKAADGKRASTVLGGALVPAADRAALGWKHGV